MDCTHQAPLSMGILQAKLLEWVTMLSSRGSSLSRDRTQVSHTAGRFFTIWATREAKNTGVGSLSFLQGIFLIQESNQGLVHCRRILTSWATREALNLPSLKHLIFILTWNYSEHLQLYNTSKQFQATWLVYRIFKKQFTKWLTLVTQKCFHIWQVYHSLIQVHSKHLLDARALSRVKGDLQFQ